MSEELIVEKKDFGFRLVLRGESYFIKDKDNGWFVLEIEKDRQVVDMVDDKYENLGASNLNDLLCKIILSPQDILEMLLGEKPEKTEKVVVEFE